MSSTSLLPGITAKEARIERPIVKVTISGAPGAPAIPPDRIQATRVEWHTGATPSRATILLHGLRVGSSKALIAGAKVTISFVRADTTSVIFIGRVIDMRQSFASSEESIELVCVDRRWDLWREVVFGQLGFMASSDTGEESSSAGPVSGLGFFNALPTLFNPKEAELEGEPEYRRTAGGDKAFRIGGNARVRAGSISPADPLPSYVFDCDGGAPFPKGSPGTRGIPWSAGAMIEYLFKWGLFELLGKVPGLGLGTPLQDDDLKDLMKLGASVGLEAVTPFNQDVTGDAVTEAVEKVAQAAGFNWWWDPALKMIEFWNAGKGRGVEKVFHLAPAPDGVATDGAVVLGKIDVATWNVDSGEISTNQQGVVDTWIGTTERIQVQNVFPLVRGWSDRVNEAFLAAVESTEKKPVSVVTADEAVVKKFPLKDHIIFTKKLMDNNNLFAIEVTPDPTAKSMGGDVDGSPHDFGKKWIFDETGSLLDINQEPRKPFHFGPKAMGFPVIHGSTYCLGPRPLLSRSVQSDQHGERFPPQVYFSKFLSNLLDRDVAKNTGLGAVIHVATRINGQEKKATVGSGESAKEVYPFRDKGGSIEILKHRGGIRLRGQIALRVMTLDPKTLKLYVFPPRVLGTVQHDQGIPRVVRSPFVFPRRARRWLDGSRFRARIAYAEDGRIATKGATDKEIYDKDSGDAVPEGSERLAKKPFEPGFPGYRINEADKLKEQLERRLDRMAPERASGRVRIPTLTVEYKPGDDVLGIRGRALTFHGIVGGVTFDLVDLNTDIEIASEPRRSQFEVP